MNEKAKNKSEKLRRGLNEERRCSQKLSPRLRLQVISKQTRGGVASSEAVDRLRLGVDYKIERRWISQGDEELYTGEKTNRSSRGRTRREVLPRPESERNEERSAFDEVESGYKKQV